MLGEQKIKPSTTDIFKCILHIWKVIILRVNFLSTKPYNQVNLLLTKSPLELPSKMPLHTPNPNAFFNIDYTKLTPFT